jgi:hypothetical protein
VATRNQPSLSINPMASRTFIGHDESPAPLSWLALPRMHITTNGKVVAQHLASCPMRLAVATCGGREWAGCPHGILRGHVCAPLPAASEPAVSTRSTHEGPWPLLSGPSGPPVHRATPAPLGRDLSQMASNGTWPLCRSRCSRPEPDCTTVAPGPVQVALRSSITAGPGTCLPDQVAVEVAFNHLAFTHTTCSLGRRQR